MRRVKERTKLFDVLLFEDICWPSGQVHVPAGTIGKAMLRWEGERAGYMVKWDGAGICGVKAGDELVRWCRVKRYRPVMWFVVGRLRIGKAGMN